MPEDKHAALQQLLQDRKTSTKGRASKWMNICLDAKLSMVLALAEQELTVAKAAAEAATEKRAGGSVPADPELAKVVTAAEKAVAVAAAAVDAASVTVTFTALKAVDWDELLKKHPPREGNEYDAASEANMTTFPDAAMRASATKVEDADGNIIEMDLDELFDTLSNGERIVACQVANDVNLRTLSVPSSDAKSQSRQRSGSRSSRR